MSLPGFASRRSSAPVARERLRILLEYERLLIDQKEDLLFVLRDEILAVLRRHVAVDTSKVQVRVDRNAHASVLEVDIEIPNSARMRDPENTKARAERPEPVR